jgi:3-oxoacyl-[acyl-carrier-protein] synthase II
MMAQQDRAVITGIGVISPLGHDPNTLLDALKQGKCAIRNVQAFNTSHFRSPFAGEINDFDPGTEPDNESSREWDDRYLHFALSAAEKAILSAGLPTDFHSERDIGIVCGTCNGGLKTAEKLYRMLHGLDPGTLDGKMNNLFRYYTFGRALAHRFNIGGPIRTVTTACSSSTGALGLALDLIHTGQVRMVLVGGSDALCLTAYSGFSGIKAMCCGISAPFSGEGDFGLNLGEGAAFWIVESADSALSRDIPIHAEILGYSLTSDAYHTTAPDPSGRSAANAMRNALKRSGITVDELGYINAHGTGTEPNDRAETRAIELLIGKEGKTPPVSSTKSYFGHCLGAAGILEATASLLAMNQNMILPTLNFTEPRPGCRLDYVPNEPRFASYDNFLSNNMAFGGNNAAVVVGSYKPDRSVDNPYDPDCRVVITGTGAVCSLGLDVTKIKQAIELDRSGIKPVASFDTQSCQSHCAGMVQDVDWKTIDRRLNLQAMNPLNRFAVQACKSALLEAGFRISPRQCESIGLILGICVGPSEESLMDTVWSTPDHLPDLSNFSVIVANSVSGITARELYLKGYNTVLSNGYHSALAALNVGFDAIKLGHADTLIAGGCDELFPRYFYNYDAVNYLVPGAKESLYGQEIFPGQQRLLGEGAAAVVMESRQSALARDAGILGEILSVAVTMDPGKLEEGTSIGTGLHEAIQSAVNKSGVGYQDLDLVLHAPQGNESDLRETRVLDELSALCPHVPKRVTTVFNTGYIESCSALLNIVVSLAHSGGRQSDTSKPYRILAVGSSIMGYNYAVVLEVPCCPIFNR